MRSVQTWMNYIENFRDLVTGRSISIGGFNVSIFGEVWFIAVVALGIFAYLLYKHWIESPRIWHKESI